MGRSEERRQWKMKELLIAISLHGVQTKALIMISQQLEKYTNRNPGEDSFLSNGILRIFSGSIKNYQSGQSESERIHDRLDSLV